MGRLAIRSIGTRQEFKKPERYTLEQLMDAADEMGDFSLERRSDRGYGGRPGYLAELNMKIRNDTHYLGHGVYIKGWGPTREEAIHACFAEANRILKVAP